MRNRLTLFGFLALALGVCPILEQLGASRVCPRPGAFGQSQANPNAIPAVRPTPSNWLVNLAPEMALAEQNFVPVTALDDRPKLSQPDSIAEQPEPGSGWNESRAELPETISASLNRTTASRP